MNSKTLTLTPFRGVGEAEHEAVRGVLNRGVLSGYIGKQGPGFLGGVEVRGLEESWAAQFGVTHAVAVNSATSGLVAALGAIGLSVGDEVIVPPLTMSATVAAVVAWGATPVFVDIHRETFCLDPAAVKAAITPNTKAILCVNLFGHPGELSRLRKIADDHNLFFIEDASQAPLAAEGDLLAGTVGDIGVFSLNVHKHIQSGEGGVCVTQDDALAEKMQLLRNHAESSEADFVGFNWRMTEVSAAIARVQLEKLEGRVTTIESYAAQLSLACADLPGLTPPVVGSGIRHAYYVWALRYDASMMGASREAFGQILTDSGVPNSLGYVKPLYHLPAFAAEAVCSEAEAVHREIVLFEMCAYELTPAVVDQISAVIQVAWEACRVPVPA